MNRRTRRGLLETAATLTLTELSELTEHSVAARSRAVDVPDFTRGRRRSMAPVRIVEPEGRG